MLARFTPLNVFALLLLFVPANAGAQDAAAQANAAPKLKLHNIFTSNMVIQRDKPIVIWGWATPDSNISVRFGERTAVAKSDGTSGVWEVTFEPQAASTTGQKLIVTNGVDTIEMDNIVIGDIWVMWGQSNMKWSLGKSQSADFELAQAHLPLLRGYSIAPSETQTEAADLRPDAVSGWSVCTPETAGDYSAIGYAFASRVQRALEVPIGIIDNARGGASLESLVPEHMFDDDPIAARYKESVEARIAEFDMDQKIEEEYQKQLAKAKQQNLPEEKWPKKSDISIRSWNIPGESPSDMGSCYNGMFGPFKKMNIKGVLFHQGYNNAIGGNCRPKLYRVLMKLMVDGIREDFRDPNLPFGVIGLCAGGISQTDENFEVWSDSTQAYIREAQRLGLADVGDPEHTGYIPPDDVQIPGLHPVKKIEHGTRAARWALSRVYDMKIDWENAELVSAEREGDTMVLTFDKKVMPDDMSNIPKGFSVAGKDGAFYRAYARYPVTKDDGIWNTANKSYDATKVIVWSPLVAEPVAVRYSWAASPTGNLKVNGQPWLPLHNFRTDEWDFPESDDPTVSAYDRATSRAEAAAAEKRNEDRKAVEAERAVEINERLKTLGHLKARD